MKNLSIQKNETLKVNHKTEKEALNNKMKESKRFLSACKTLIQCSKEDKNINNAFLSLILDRNASNKKRLIKTDILVSLMSEAQKQKYNEQKKYIYTLFLVNKENTEDKIKFDSVTSPTYLNEAQLKTIFEKRREKDVKKEASFYVLAEYCSQSIETKEDFYIQSFSAIEIQALIHKAEKEFHKFYKDVSVKPLNLITLKKALNLETKDIKLSNLETVNV